MKNIGNLDGQDLGYPSYTLRTWETEAGILSTCPRQPGPHVKTLQQKETTKQNTKVGHLDTQSQERISLPSEEKTCMKVIQSLASFIDAFIFFFEKFKILHFASDPTQLPLVLTLYP